MDIVVRYTEENEAHARKTAEALQATDAGLHIAVLPLAEREPIVGLAEEAAGQLVKHLSARAEELGAHLTVALYTLEPDTGTGFGVTILLDEESHEALKIDDGPEMQVIKEALFSGPLSVKTVLKDGQRTS